MDRPYIERGRRQGPPALRISLIVLAILLIVSARSIASYAIDVEWWKELGQFRTWLSMLYYSIAPVAAATVVAFAALWVTHARAVKFARASLRDYPVYARLSTLALLLLAWLISAAAINTWTVVRFAGSRGLPAAATAWQDSVFGKPLSFYLFDLPFYNLLRGYTIALLIACIVLYWATARAWQLRYQLPQMRNAQEIDPSMFRLEGGLESSFLRYAAVLLLLAFAARYFLDRYQMLYNTHGTFLVGMDYVDQHIALPLRWLVILACLAAAALVAMRQWKLAAAMALALPVAYLVPAAVAALYVRPNEISLQRPFIQSHIHATRAAYGLEQLVTEVDFKAHPDAAIDVTRHRDTLDNVPLWEWKSFHDTITQIQALRTYYSFHDSDWDRYNIDNRYKQVLLAPREIDINQLPDARANWINPAFIYTHGYGLVLSEVSKATQDGLPALLIDNAPPEVKTKSLKLDRPEIYYGESTHEPVFVNTAQKEFNYPSGEQNAYSNYEGKGGFPISSFPMRLAAAIHEAEPNILLTDYFTANSRMMIHRKVMDRVKTLAGFLEWDDDPYLVITDSGRLVWTVDGYTTSDAHPYARPVNAGPMGRINYIRNAVKATVDAYDGETHFYVFAPEDPIIAAYQQLFPDLLLPASQMPADLRTHARYPETMFRVQAEIYRTYHMLDPQAFYNKEDVWDIALHAAGSNAAPAPFDPQYVVAALPGESKPEFLLMLPFTPRSKNNLIGVMMARCDGDKLGKVTVLLLSKQELIQGPMNISAFINQDQNIAKDLNLWNQQGSQVLRGQILVLPVGETFLYVQPIYIQARAGSMPQLKKVVLATGNRLIYTDTYEQALAQLAGGARAPVEAPTITTTAAPSPLPPGADARLKSVRDHLRRYRELMAQGKFAEAGKELEALEAAAR